MRRNKFGIACLMLLPLILAGCGGSTNVTPGGGGDSTTDFDGIYTSAFTRSTGTITIGVRGRNLEVTVDDSEAGFFSGTGTVGANRTFSVTCTNEAGATVTVTGSLAKAAGLRHAAGTVRGTISVDYNADFGESPTLSLYANHYTGDSTGNGPIHFEVAADGTVTGMFGNFSIAGTVTRTGYLAGSLMSGDHEAGRINGQLRIGTSQVNAKGGYRFSTLHGQWNAHSNGG